MMIKMMSKIDKNQLTLNIFLDHDSRIIYNNHIGDYLYILNDRQWVSNEKCHNAYNHAIITINGSKHWYVNGVRHNSNGPAIIMYNGHIEWWVDGEFIKETYIGLN